MVLVTVNWACTTGVANFYFGGVFHSTRRTAAHFPDIDVLKPIGSVAKKCNIPVSKRSFIPPKNPAFSGNTLIFEV